MRAAVTVASLNIRGFGSDNIYNPNNKWLHVNQVMRDKKIGVLVVQETHMDKERRRQVEGLFQRRLRIFATGNPEHPTGKGGVAIVLNKDIVRAEEATATTLKEGRALSVHVPHKQGKGLTVLGIYAPNDPIQNEYLWEDLADFYDNPLNNGVPRPNMMLGDFNMVEQAIDRMPQHDDRRKTVAKLSELCIKLNLHDGWRDVNPTEKVFTYHQKATGSQSRIDRIYATKRICLQAREWLTRPTGIPNTDHMMVSFSATQEDAPSQGPGRRTVPMYVLRDQRMKGYTVQHIRDALHDLDALRGWRSPEYNPQRILHDLKMDIRNRAIDHQRRMVPTLIRDLKATEDALRNTLDDESIGEAERKTVTSTLTERLRKLEQKRHNQVRKEVRLKNRIEGETISKSWCRLGKEIAPRDVIYALRRPSAGTGDDPPPDTNISYEKDSAKMAQMARNYHESLQAQDLEKDELKRIHSEMTVLKNITARPTDAQSENLATPITRDEVVLALKSSKKDSAAGLDGLTYDFWAELQKQSLLDPPEQENAEETHEKNDTLDLLDLMTEAFNDIQEYGIDKTTNFAEGWMCPIFKKKDRTDIANYRPITLLNTDYKLYTKALTFRLAHAVPHLIHKAQAGFIPGRQIHNHTQLTHMIIEMAAKADPVEDEDGMIVALDQEKAYDKISHNYLWATLRQFRIPESFIRSVQTLYESAETRVMINGCLSSPYRVTRGVRQGDPLSCLLFDLAIEPLAASLRASSLRGYNIPGAPERLIATLFADDTTTFLHKDDSFVDLMSILDLWCAASGAKFNKEKTEVIPIGNPAYRAELLISRKPSLRGQALPDHIHIAADGEAIRILGAWHGNDVDENQVWTPTVNKVEAALAQWEKAKPTMAGRKHVIQMVVGGMTQYKAKVQGMPKKIEDTLDKRIRTFMWADKTQSPVNKPTLHAPTNEGGMGVLDIIARNKSIEVEWLRDYLTFGPDRPLWALVADKILARSIRTAEVNLPFDLRQNVFLQSWSAKTSAIPHRLRKSFKVAHELGLRREGLAFERRILRDMPIWLHGEASNRMRRLNHSRASRCLHEAHKLVTVGEAEDLAKNLANADHKPRRNCACVECKRVRRETACLNPHGCFSRAKDLLDLLPPKWDPRQPQPEDTEAPPPRPRLDPKEGEEGDWIPFGGAITTRGDLSDIFRIFTKGETTNTTHLKRATRPDCEHVVAATDGSCYNNGRGDAIAGAGVFIGEDHPNNISIRLPNEIQQSNQTGEILAVSEAARSLNPAMQLYNLSDSRLTINEATVLQKAHEDIGYIGIANAPSIRAMIGNLRQRAEATYFKWVKGHKGHTLNEGADRLAGLGAQKATPDEVDLVVPNTLTVTGAKLKQMTQKLAYTAIREKEMETYQKRPRTVDNLTRAIDNIDCFFGITPSESAIWKGLRHKDIRKEVRYFLWMAAHDAYMIGTNWQRANYSPELQQRGECEICGRTETMEHILSECDAPGQRQIWQMAKLLWKKRNKKWPRPSLGAILSCPIAPFVTKQGKPKTGDARLYRILMTESAHLIWKLRNERVIRQSDEAAKGTATRDEISARWLAALNARLTEDCALTDPGKYGKRALKPGLVERTWSSTLDHEDDLPHEWWRGRTGVLVGIDPIKLGDEDVSEASWSDDDTSVA